MKGNPDVEIAGFRIEDPVGEICEFLRSHPKTVRQYDFAAGASGLTPDLIRRTRAPLMGSRISSAEGEWFLEQSSSAPWTLVEQEAHLAKADPLEEGGLYDRALALYKHFASEPPQGVNFAKIHKVLYLTRPHLYPILDSRMQKLYRSKAAEAASRLRGSRDLFKDQKFMYWAAIRDDLVRDAVALGKVREELRQGLNELEREGADRLSDLRLLDMIGWRMRK